MPEPTHSGGANNINEYQSADEGGGEGPKPAPGHIGTIDALLAPVMFYAAVLFLALIAAIMVLWVDVPRVVEMAEVLDAEVGDNTTGYYITPEERALEAWAFKTGWYVLYLLLGLWGLFLVEQLYRWYRYRRDSSYAGRSLHGWIYLLFPPLRLGAQRHGETNWIWLPVWHWQAVDRRLQRRLERVFSIPMFWIALMILPVLGLQFYFKHRIADHPYLRAILHIGTGTIWFAFAVEFIVMVSVAKDKLKYCKDHWLDIAIIVLPMISFLRSVRALQAMRLLPATQLGQLSKAARVYRLRGVVMRAVRAMMILDLLTRLLRIPPEKKLKKLQELREEKAWELAELDAEIEALRAQIEANRGR